jgi:hypothetical protein
VSPTVELAFDGSVWTKGRRDAGRSASPAGTAERERAGS